MAIEQKLRFLLWTGYFLACYILMVDSQVFVRERMTRVIITGAGVPHMGNVMVATGMNQGQFRPICDDFFSMKEAHAVCVNLGFHRALRFTRRNYFGKKSQRWTPDGWMSLYRLQCPDEGPIGVLKECRVLENTKGQCTADEIAGVECQTDSTNYGCSPNDFICRGRPSRASKLSSLCISPSHLCDGMSHCPDSSDEDEDLCSEKGIITLLADIRTELPENSVAGTIFIKHNSTWGTFCGFGASEISAHVACRALGYTRGIRRFFYQGYYGEGPKQLPVRGPVQCMGHEPTLEQCPGFSSTSQCPHKHDAGVFCHDGDFSLRLVGGRTSTSGSLEITSTGASSPAAICDTGFDDLDAQVVCRMLGFDSTRSIALRGSPFGMDSRNIWNIILDCYGDERNINECKIKISSKPCNQRQTAAVTCMSDHLVDQVLRSVLPADCGEPVDASTRFLTTLGKIRGGTTPSRFDIPWLAQLRKRNFKTGDYEHHCGAVIISEFYLLTAAHCLKRSVGRLNTIVSIGNYNNNYNDPFQRDFLIDKVRVHEHFEELGFAENDIALIKIEAVNGQGIRFDERVKPVCLPRVGDIYDHLSSCQISGWGITSNLSRGPLFPKVASVSMSPDIHCEWIGSSRNYTSSTVCVGGQNLRIPCSGDSGGPLTCPGNRGRHILYGLISRAPSCRIFIKHRFPASFVRITKYLRWIQENIISTF